jgi:hypothetical protein
MKEKIDTSKHFEKETEFDYLLVNDNLSRAKINRQRLIRDAWDCKIGNKTKDSQKLIEKIKSASIRQAWEKTTESDVIERIIQGDDITIGQFMVDPKKQHGKLIGAEYLQTFYIQNKLSEFNGVEIKRMNNKGSKSERIIDGSIVCGIEKNENTTKSLDCEIKNDFGLRIRCINKATTSLLKDINDKGGAQDNQLQLSEKDVDKINFDLSINKDLYIVFILDGKFYKKNSYVLGLIDKYKNNKHVYFTTSDGIKEVIGTILYN